MGRPRKEEREPFTVRVKPETRKRLKISAVTHDVNPSEVIDALVDQFFEYIDWSQVGGRNLD